MNLVNAFKVGLAVAVVGGLATGIYMQHKANKREEEKFLISMRKTSITLTLSMMESLMTLSGNRGMSKSDIDFIAECIVAMRRGFPDWDLDKFNSVRARLDQLSRVYFYL